jgi:hypothetical protein
MQAHKQARMSHATWPDQKDLHQVTKGRFALHSQSVQAVFRAFLGTIETTRTLRKEHPERRMKYPWRTKTFYPLKWPAQAVNKRKGRVVLPMGKGHPSLVLPLDLPDNAGACILVWNYGFELHVCVEVPQASEAPGTVQATVDLGEIHLAAVTTGTGKALIVTGRGIRSLKRQRSRQLGRLSRKQSRCTKHSRRWKKLQHARNKVCRRAERRVRDPLAQGHPGGDRLLRQEPGGHALRRQPRMVCATGTMAGIITNACRCGSMGATSTISPINPGKPASCARPAPNEEPAAGVPCAGTSTSPEDDNGRAASVALPATATSSGRSICIRRPSASM